MELFCKLEAYRTIIHTLEPPKPNLTELVRSILINFFKNTFLAPEINTNYALLLLAFHSADLSSSFSAQAW